MRRVGAGLVPALPTERGEAERRQAQTSIVRATQAACCHAVALRAQRAPSGARSPVGVPPRLSPGGSRPFRPAPGQASWDAARAHDPVSPPQPGGERPCAADAGVTRARLSQSRESTSRTGRNAGQHDARSCPGADCIFPRAGTALAPHSGVPSAEGVPR